MFLEYLNVSLLMMRAKPVRSILSLLGIYIGVLSLVIILAIREGVRLQIEGLFRTRGAHVVFIHPGFDPVSKRIGQLTLDDVRRLRSVPGIVSVMPRVSGDMNVRTRSSTLHAHMAGVDDEFIALYRVSIINGRGFLKEEVIKKQPVCLLTAETARKLYPVVEPVGASLDVNGLPFKVIGVVNWNAETAQRTSLQDVDMLVPGLWFAPKEGEFISSLEARIRPEITAEQAVNIVKIAVSHGEASRENLYFIRSLEEYVERSREMNDRILGGLLGIAGISLLVGAIGVANVMITSVTERTKEVGIRKALGATRFHILSQFLVEASVLSVSGGLLAVLTGAVGVSVAPTLFNVTFPLVIPVLPSVGCLVMTVFIGLVAGVYPASRAAGVISCRGLEI